MDSSLSLQCKKTHLLSWRNHRWERKIKKVTNLWDWRIERLMILSCSKLRGKTQLKTRYSRTSTLSIQTLLKSPAKSQIRENLRKNIKLRKFLNFLITNSKELHKFIEVGIKDTLKKSKQIIRLCLNLKAQSKTALSKSAYLSIRTCVGLKAKLGQGSLSYQSSKHSWISRTKFLWIDWRSNSF